MKREEEEGHFPTPEDSSSTSPVLLPARIPCIPI